jgi:Tripartite tricarboxylate transporter family receptor
MGVNLWARVQDVGCPLHEGCGESHSSASGRTYIPHNTPLCRSFTASCTLKPATPTRGGPSTQPPRTVFRETGMGVALVQPWGTPSNFPVVNFCVWPRVPPRSLQYRASRGRKPPHAPGAHRRRLASGGVIDITARLMGQWLSERMDQPFVIENRPSAGGNIAAEAVVRAPLAIARAISSSGSRPPRRAVP